MIFYPVKLNWTSGKPYGVAEGLAAVKYYLDIGWVTTQVFRNKSHPEHLILKPTLTPTQNTKVVDA